VRTSLQTGLSHGFTPVGVFLFTVGSEIQVQICPHWLSSEGSQGLLTASHLCKKRSTLLRFWLLFKLLAVCPLNKFESWNLLIPYSGIRVIAQVIEHLPSNHESLWQISKTHTDTHTHIPPTHTQEGVLEHSIKVPIFQALNVCYHLFTSQTVYHSVWSQTHGSCVSACDNHKLQVPATNPESLCKFLKPLLWINFI
jgi:hypothetical protein